jgi:hypothetical protein
MIFLVSGSGVAESRSLPADRSGHLLHLFPARHAPTGWSIGRRSAGAGLFLAFGRALRARVADPVQHLDHRDRRFPGRDARQRVSAGDIEGALASMRVGAVLHPAVFFALDDGPGLL